MRGWLLAAAGWFLVSASPGMAAELKLAVGLSLPPYIIKASESGMEWEIVAAALAKAGHVAKPVYVPFARVPVMVGNGEADGALTVNASSGIQGVVYSVPVIEYQNVATVLTGSGLQINNLADLKGRNVTAFQNATKYLGEAYAQAVAGATYTEVADQVKQNLLLHGGRTDVVIGDRNIFTYFDQQVPADARKPVTMWTIFPPTPYSVAFRDAAIKDAFDAALKALRDSGDYAKIIAKYVP